MAKQKLMYQCEACGYRAPKWLGQCGSCGQWDAMQEVRVDGGPRGGRATRAKTTVYDDIPPEALKRFGSGSREFDRVLGGGFVPGSLILLGGDPGIGKSTLMLQVAAHLQQARKKVLYVSGEESLAQIRMRGERLGLDGSGLTLLAETSFESLEQVLEKTPFDIVFIDSIQTMYSAAVASAPGSVTQVRDIAAKLLTLAKPINLTVVLIGHITKQGNLAGPKTLEHVVDGVFYFEGGKTNHLRLIRAQKNRFGPVQELAIFQMEGTGLIEVPNPSQVLLAQRPEACAGSVVVPCIEGTRPLLVEIQVLLSTSTYASPRRVAMGVDGNRLALIMAVLEKKAGLQLQGLDAFVNVVGGISIQEPAIDLGLALAIWSSFRNIALNGNVAIFGELGLAGEVRSVNQAALRMKECQALGFDRIICPTLNAAETLPGLRPAGVATLAEALEQAL